jgi:hypothetical protein
MDQSVIAGNNPEGVEYKMAAVSSAGDFMMVYIPYGRKTIIHTSQLRATRLRAWWFNPRDGRAIRAGEFDNTGSREFVPSSIGRGSDWVLVIDDATKNYPEPNAF